MIPQRNLSLLSNRLAREGGRRIPEAVLERDYCLAWFLVGLSHTPLRKHLVFKGGSPLDKAGSSDLCLMTPRVKLHEIQCHFHEFRTRL